MLEMEYNFNILHFFMSILKHVSKLLVRKLHRYFLISIGPVKQKKNVRKIAIIFLSNSLNMCFGCLEEPTHRDGSFEYPQRMFWLRNKKTTFQLRTLIWGPDKMLIFILVKEALFYTGKSLIGTPLVH